MTELTIVTVYAIICLIFKEVSQMTAFALKMIAIFTMFLDHLGYFIYNGLHSAFNYFGRITFPIFAFQISEGYIHTHDIKKYFLRLFIFAVISQLPFILYLQNVLHSGFELNIFFTLILGLFSIFIYDKSPNKLLGILIVALTCYFGELIKVDYGYWGVLLIFMFYLLKNNKVLTIFAFLLMCILKYSGLIYTYGFNIIYIYLGISTFLAIIPITLYNGKLGPKTKKLLYVFYPAHLFLFYLASLIG